MIGERIQVVSHLQILNLNNLDSERIGSMVEIINQRLDPGNFDPGNLVVLFVFGGIYHRGQSAKSGGLSPSKASM